MIYNLLYTIPLFTHLDYINRKETFILDTHSSFPPTKAFTWRGHSFEAVLNRSKDEYLYRIYILKGDGFRLLNADLYPQHAHPQRAVSCSCKVKGENQDRLVTYLHTAATRLTKKAQPYFDSLDKPTLWTLYRQHETDFYAYYIHHKNWHETTVEKYKNQFLNHLQPIYQDFTLPFTLESFSQFSQRFYNQPYKTDYRNDLISKHRLFMDYLCSRGYYMGVEMELSYQKRSREEELKARFSIVRSLGSEFRRSLIHRLLNDLKAGDENSPLSLGLLLMLLCGLRTSEAVGLEFGDIYWDDCCLYVHQQQGGKRLKTTNSYRILPMDFIICEALSYRLQYVANQIANPQVPDSYPLVCGTLVESHASSGALSSYAYRIFMELGITDDLLLHYQRLMSDIPTGELRNEDSVHAYILRRDYITRLYQLGLEMPMIEYLSAHARSTHPNWKPVPSDLETARQQMDEYWVRQNIIKGSVIL